MSLDNNFNLEEKDRFSLDNKDWFVSEVIFESNTRMYRCVSDVGDDVIFHHASLEKEYNNKKLLILKD